VYYQQKERNYCLAYCIASALCYIGFGKQADMIAKSASLWEHLPGEVAILKAITQLSQLIPELGQHEMLNWRCRKKPMKVLPWFNCPTPNTIFDHFAAVWQ
jgi:hypothetical protein